MDTTTTQVRQRNARIVHVHFESNRSPPSEGFFIFTHSNKLNMSIQYWSCFVETCPPETKPLFGDFSLNLKHHLPALLTRDKFLPYSAVRFIAETEIMHMIRMKSVYFTYYYSIYLDYTKNIYNTKLD